ncbi:hypothetical protein NMY22_g4985 [Coprinellus aureogranulatus]|nr:hypothetical protein NMY22_g4985 [Coprinellus aureogranulatus]
MRDSAGVHPLHLALGNSDLLTLTGAAFSLPANTYLRLRIEEVAFQAKPPITVKGDGNLFHRILTAAPQTKGCFV